MPMDELQPSFKTTSRLDGVTWRLVACVGTCLLGCLLSAGYNIGVVNIPQQMLMQFSNSSMSSVYGVQLTPAGLDIVWSTVVSVFLAGAMTGSLVAGSLADRFGRKRVVLLTELLMLVSAVLLSAGYSFNRIDVFLLGRCLVGFDTGLATTISALYLHEVSPRHLQGVLGTITNSGCCNGMLISMIVGLPQFLGTPERCWLLMCAFVLLTLAGLSLLPFCPESPKYLFSVGREAEAVQVLMQLRGTSEQSVQAEVDDCKMECKRLATTAAWSLARLVGETSTRWRLVVLLIVCAGQQLSGINAIMLFSTSIFLRAGLSAGYSQLATVGCMVVQCVVAVGAGAVVGRCRLHRLTTVSCVGSGLCLAVFGVALALMEQYQWAALLSTVAVLAYIMFFAVGLGPVPWLLGAYMFEQGPRSAAVSAGTGSIWLSSCLVVLFFPSFYSLLASWCFIVFVVCCLGCGYVAYRYIPPSAVTAV